jgi:hypothetical protein
MERKMMDTENRFVKTRIALVGLAVALAAALLLLVGLTKPSQAANGDILRTLNVTPAPQCSITVGIAFDGNELLTSCNENQTITRVDPATGNNLGSYEVSGTQGEGIGAMSWDAEHNQLWTGTANSTPYRIYKVQLDKANSTGVATLAFEVNVPGFPIVDGLAYDGTDDSIWMSPDVDGTVYNFDQAGTLLETIDVAGKLGGCGNSGITVADEQTLYLANNGCEQIFSAKKDGSTIEPFASLQGKRVEDLECDNTTFKNDGKSVIWSKDAFDFELNAFEVPEGQCAQGGVVDPPPPTCTFSEILPPVNDVASEADTASMSAYKQGGRGSVPAKFQVTCDGDPVDTQAEADAHPMVLTLTRLATAADPQADLEPTVTGSANTGKYFRFVDADDHYIYNIGLWDEGGTKRPKGLYRIRISEATDATSGVVKPGGATHDEWFQIK